MANKGITLKLRAFTLIEICVVMSITVIVVLIAYTTLNLINTQFDNYKTSSKTSSDICQLYNLLQHDFENASSVSCYDDDLQFKFKNGQIHSYLIYDDKIIICLNNISDTFNLQITNRSFFFDTERISNGVIDRARFEILLNTKSLGFDFYKLYDAATLLRIKS